MHAFVLLLVSACSFFLGWWGSSIIEDHGFSNNYWMIALPLCIVTFLVTVYSLKKAYFHARPLILLYTCIVIGVTIARIGNGLDISYQAILILFAFLVLFIFFTNHLVLLAYRIRRISFRMPSTEEEILRLSERGAIPVSGGWSFLLKHEQAPSDMFLLTRWSGVISDDVDSITVKSGTTFADIQKYLDTTQRTFVDRPQFNSLTIGGAVAVDAHGFCGAAWFSSFVKQIRIGVNSESKDISVSEYYVHYQKSIILTVTIQVVKNRSMLCRRSSYKTFDAIHLNLFNNCEYRMLLVNGTGFELKTAVKTDLKMSNSCSSLRYENMCFYFGCVRGKTERVCKLSSAHLAISYLIPLELIFIPFYYNFEMMTKENVQIIPLIHALQKYHQQYGGHSDIRKNMFLTSIEFATTSPLQQSLLDILYRVGVRKIKFHPGKYVYEEIRPLKFWH